MTAAEGFEELVSETTKAVSKTTKIYKDVKRQLLNWRKYTFRHTDVGDQEMELILAHVCACKRKTLKTCDSATLLTLVLTFINNIPLRRYTCDFGKGKWESVKSSNHEFDCRLMLGEYNCFWRIQPYLMELKWRAGSMLEYVGVHKSLPNFNASWNPRSEATVELTVNSEICSSLSHCVNGQRLSAEAGSVLLPPCHERIMSLLDALPFDYFDIIAVLVRLHEVKKDVDSGQGQDEVMPWLGLKVLCTGEELLKRVLGPNIDDSEGCERFRRLFDGNKIVEVTVPGVEGACLAVDPEYTSGSWEESPHNEVVIPDLGSKGIRCSMFTYILRNILRRYENGLFCVNSGLRLCSSSQDHDDELVNDTLQDITSLLSSLECVSITEIERMTVLRGLMGSHELLSRDVLPSPNVHCTLAQLGIRIDSEKDWLDKPVEWQTYAKHAVLISILRELQQKGIRSVALHSTKEMSDDPTDPHPYLDVTAYVRTQKAGFLDALGRQNERQQKDGNTQRKLVVRIWLRVGRIDPSPKENWVVNGRWMPPPDRQLVAYDSASQSWNAYLDSVIPNRSFIRRHHYLPSLARDVEVWRHRCPAFDAGLKLMKLWLVENYLNLSDDWVISLLICGLIYQEYQHYYAPVQDVVRTAVAGREFNHLRYVSANEIVCRAILLIAHHDSDKVLPLPLANDSGKPHNPAKPLLNPVPNNGQDYQMVLGKCFDIAAKVSTKPAMYMVAAFDPRGVLVASPDHVVTMHLRALAKKCSGLIQGYNNLARTLSACRSEFRKYVKAAVVFKSPTTLSGDRDAGLKNKYKNVVKKSSAVPVDETFTQIEIMAEAIRDIEAIFKQGGGYSIVYKAKSPYPLILLVIDSLTLGHSSPRKKRRNDLDQVCDLVQQSFNDLVEYVLSDKESLSTILAAL
ncbi:hypothetical protein GNI_135060 [Gregarina niphandrodes]|uniref:Uncharacterized protein n=1 Tax=Gregarina niphandrodes TaxID=110365 RepID=A0A023B162_GRENI|nr:hypothetical protein GNI_135060 [Gregarina niphandrodes]EZG46108.1 hypothetical protein GNI_135060 [Gregarina niphandrodes]|eukprot:XP_011132364.1 hypothetical protein GNI_135060 [Gregarina niphandrodes]